MIKMARGLQPDQWKVRGFYVLDFLEIAPNFYLTKFTNSKTGKGVQQWAIFEARDDREQPTYHMASDHTDYFKPLLTLKRNRSRWSGRVMAVWAYHDLDPANYNNDRNVPAKHILLEAAYPDKDEYLPVALDTMVSFANFLGVPVEHARFPGQYKEMFDAEVSANRDA